MLPPPSLPHWVWLLRHRCKEDDRHVVAVIGDGSMTGGGLAYEGLNNACSQPNNLLIILNDNNMSIDNNVGGLQDYLVKLTTSSKYNKMRHDVSRASVVRNLISERDKNRVRVSATASSRSSPGTKPL